MHSGLNLIPLHVGLSSLSYLYLVVLLDERAAGAPERHTAVIAAAALDPVPFADLGTLYHGVAVPHQLA